MSNKKFERDTVQQPLDRAVHARFKEYADANGFLYYKLLGKIVTEWLDTHEEKGKK